MVEGKRERENWWIEEIGFHEWRRKKEKKQEDSVFRMIIYSQRCKAGGFDKTLSRLLSGSSAKRVLHLI